MILGIRYVRSISETSVLYLASCSLEIGKDSKDSLLSKLSLPIFLPSYCLPFQSDIPEGGLETNIYYLSLIEPGFLFLRLCLVFQRPGLER